MIPMVQNPTLRLAIYWVPVIVLIGAYGDWPYVYYTLLRVIVFFAALSLAYDIYNRTSKVALWCAAFIAVAILFNPLLPIHLARGIWAVIDPAIAALFIAHFFKGHHSPRFDDG